MTRKISTTRRKPATALDAFSLAASSAELTLATMQVVAARTPMIAKALRDPLRGNYAELTRMVTEKPVAFARGAMAGGPGWIAMAAESNRYLTHAWKVPNHSASGMTAALDMFQFWGRMMSLGVAWQAATMAPVHTVAMANARRLAPRA